MNEEEGREGRAGNRAVGGGQTLARRDERERKDPGRGISPYLLITNDYDLASTPCLIHGCGYGIYRGIVLGQDLLLCMELNLFC